MRVLVIASSWNNQNAVGNTYSNWFGGKEWVEDDFACLCFRNSPPCNTVCKKYYRFTDIENLKNILTPEKIGSTFLYEYKEAGRTLDSDAELKEQQLVTLLHKKPNHFVYHVQEVLRAKGLWVNKKFKVFLSEFNPDIIFTTINGSCMPKALYQCIRENTHAKIVFYASDDMIGKYRTYPLYRRAMQIKGFKYALSCADKVYGASELLSKEYGKLFQIPIVPLYKGCEFQKLNYQKNDGVLHLVYAGNLLYGRADTLAVLAQCICKLNHNGRKMILDVYTGTFITPEIKHKLNIPGASQIIGKKPYTEIKSILNCADMVLHVESFEKEQIDYVHYSFSTKIMDCLQSGSASLAIGPAGIASIEYMRKIPGVRVIDSLDAIESTVQEIDEHRMDLLYDAEASRAFAVQNHELSKIRAALRHDFEVLLIENN